MSRAVFLWSNGTTWMIDWVGLGLPGFPQIPIVAAGTDLFTVAGLNGTVVTTNGFVDNDPFPALLDPNIWFSRKVPYPAAAFPPASSLTSGVNKVIDAINAIPPGVKFALGGYSQGAVVMGTVASRGLFPGTSGVLSGRQGDFLGGVTFGDPIRPVDHVGANGAFGTYSGTWTSLTRPGVVQRTGGGGCFPADGPFPRLSSAPENWLSLSAQFDPFTTNPPAGSGLDINRLLTLFLGSSSGAGYISAVLSAVGIVGSVLDMLSAATRGVSVRDAAGKSFTSVGHGSYAYSINESTGLTYYQCGVQHLNNLLAPFLNSPSLLPSNPTGTSTRTAGWTTQLTA